MLSIGAFNALLKTLEEPPSYVSIYLGDDGGPQDPDHDPVPVPEIRFQADLDRYHRGTAGGADAVRSRSM